MSGVQDGGSFPEISPKDSEKSAEKVLTEGQAKFLFNPPSARSRTKVGFDADGGGKESGSFGYFFRKSSEKGLTVRTAKFLLETFP